MKKNRKVDIDDFLSQEKIAVLGVSRSLNKFGNQVYRELKKHGYSTYPINPHANEIEGEQCWVNLKSLPEVVDGIIIVVPSDKTEQMVIEAKEVGIKRIWIQYGAFSQKAVDYCVDNNISVIANECILMFLEPVESVHKIHRWIWKLIGKYPK